MDGPIDDHTCGELFLIGQPSECECWLPYGHTGSHECGRCRWTWKR